MIRSSTKRQTPKVFGIGFHKTGTSSLGKALKRLGYRVSGPFGVHDANTIENVLDVALEKARHFDAFQDNPWPLLYKELDARFPGSKFILTVRSTETWLGSVRRHFAACETPMRKWIYGAGSPIGNEGRYIEVYEAHNAAVRAYFASRPEDLLILDLPAGDGWLKLCNFLDVEVLDGPFVHANSAHSRESYWRRTVEWCKQTHRRGATHREPAAATQAS